MKNRWHNRVFFDLLAGCGKCVDEDTGEEFDGSLLRAVQCNEPFTQAICVESDPGLADALEQRTMGKALVIRDDCNDPKIIEQLRASLGYGILGLAFVDKSRSGRTTVDDRGANGEPLTRSVYRVPDWRHQTQHP
jgi:hypothetical protein